MVRMRLMYKLSLVTRHSMMKAVSYLDESQKSWIELCLATVVPALSCIRVQSYSIMLLTDCIPVLLGLILALKSRVVSVKVNVMGLGLSLTILVT